MSTELAQSSLPDARIEQESSSSIRAPSSATSMEAEADNGRFISGMEADEVGEAGGRTGELCRLGEGSGARCARRFLRRDTAAGGGAVSVKKARRVLRVAIGTGSQYLTMLRTLTDLHMTRLTGNDNKLKAKLLSTVKACIETRHPDFLGDHQQDAHEFLMVCLSYLKEEGELQQSYWSEYTCRVANMEFQLNRLRTCDSCGFQRSFIEDYNYLSLVISPQGCLIDSLQQYFKRPGASSHAL